MIKSVYQKTTQEFSEFLNLTKNASPLTVAATIGTVGVATFLLGTHLDVQAQNEIMAAQGMAGWEKYVQNIGNPGVFDLVRMGFHDIFTGENTLKAANEGRKLFSVGTGVAMLSVPAGIIKRLSDVVRDILEESRQVNQTNQDGLQKDVLQEALQDDDAESLRFGR